MKIDISNIKLLDSLSIYPGNLIEKLNFLDPWIIEFSDISIDLNMPGTLAVYIGPSNTTVNIFFNGNERNLDNPNIRIVARMDSSWHINFISSSSWKDNSHCNSHLIAMWMTMFSV